MSLLNSLLNNLGSGLSYLGTWNASTNTPTLTSSVGSNGTYYIVSTAGSTNLNGITDWQVGDWAVFNGSVWQKIDQTDTKALWGEITGTLSNQTDLQNALNAKVDLAGDTMTGNILFGTDIGLKASGSGGFTLRSSNDDIVLKIGASGSGTLSFNQLTTNGLLQVSGGAVSSRANNNIITESTTSRTLAIGDAFSFIFCTNASATTITIPLNSSVAFEIGTQIDICQSGAGKVTISATGGVTINSLNSVYSLAGQYAAATIKKTATDTWLLMGAIVG